VLLFLNAMPIEIEGLSDLSRMLTEESPAAAKRYLLRCAKPAAQVVIDAADETVPVDVGVLEESMGSQTSWSSGDGETALEINVGPLKSAWWGSLQEFGTRTNPAQHWLSRAWESCKDKVLDVFATEAVGLVQDLENKR
jgi:HK97 gp10 family phage protein